MQALVRKGERFPFEVLSSDEFLSIHYACHRTDNLPVPSLVGPERPPEKEDLAHLLAIANVEARSDLELQVLKLAYEKIADAQRLELLGDHEEAREHWEAAEVDLGHIVDHTVDNPRSAAYPLTASEQESVSKLKAEGVGQMAALAQVVRKISPKERDTRSREAWRSGQRRKTLFLWKGDRDRRQLRLLPVRTVRPNVRPRGIRRPTRSAPKRGSPRKSGGEEPHHSVVARRSLTESAP